MDGENLKCLRLKTGLTLTDVSDQIGIDPSLLSKYERGKRKISSEVADRLTEFYHYILNHIEQNDYLEAKFDWVRVRIRTNNWHAVMASLLHIDPDEFIYKHSGKFGYVECYTYGSIQVFNSVKGDSRGVMIELSGQGCREYESILNELSETWRDFFQRCIETGTANFTRIDCALDDKKEIVSIPDLIEKYRKGHYETLFRTGKAIDERDMKTKKQESKNAGATLYLGSRQGTIHFAFYQKNYEQAKKLKVAIEDIEVKNRYEIRMMNKKANYFVDQFLNNHNAALLVRSVINRYVTFYDYDRNKKELVLSKKWHELIQSTVDVDFKMEPREVSLEKSFRWFRYQVGRVYKMAKLYGEKTGDDFLAKTFEEVELSEDDEKVLDQAVKDSADVIFVDRVGFMNRETGEVLGQEKAI